MDTKKNSKKRKRRGVINKPKTTKDETEVFDINGILSFPIGASLRLRSWDPTKTHCGSNCVSEVLSLIYLQDEEGFKEDFDTCKSTGRGIEPHELQAYLDKILVDRKSSLENFTRHEIGEKVLEKIPLGYMTPLLCYRDGSMGHAMLIAHDIDSTTGESEAVLIDQSSPITSCPGGGGGGGVGDGNPHVYVFGNANIEHYLNQQGYNKKCLVIKQSFITHSSKKPTYKSIRDARETLKMGILSSRDSRLTSQKELDSKFSAPFVPPVGQVSAAPIRQQGPFTFTGTFHPGKTVKNKKRGGKGKTMKRRKTMKKRIIF
jgi:hypothetical protein